MKSKLYFLALISIAFVACQQSAPKNSVRDLESDTLVSSSTDTAESTAQATPTYALALSQNALQLVNKSSGSTKELAFGTSFEQTIATIERILQLKPTVGINSECGAGPLKMATWDNGLTLLFQEKKQEWSFVGWAANKAKNPALKISTMAGIGVGSTRKEMEIAYVIKVNKTSLGDEFSTKGDNLFGIFDGPGEDAQITNLWSGVSCNFR